MAKNILLIEDDADTSALLEELLLSAGCQVTKAHDLEQVKTCLRKMGSPDLVIADLQIPGCAYDGETIDTIKSMCRPSDVPILLISATTGVQALANMYNVNYLEKPFDIDDLMEYTVPKITSSQ